MHRRINDWQVENVSQGGPPVSLASISQAIEALVEVSKKDMGETLDFLHSRRGAIICTAGKGRSTLTFVPGYDQRNHSLVGSRNARSNSGGKKLYHVDGVGSVSAIPPDCLLSIVDVVLGLVYIFENHDFPAFLRWTGPAVQC